MTMHETHPHPHQTPVVSLNGARHGETDAEMDDFETALSDPSAYYADPDAILADEELSLEQRRRFLAEWAQDLADRLQADSEGMSSADPALMDADADLLRRVQAALEQLDGTADTGGDRPAKSFWKRLLPF